MSSVVQPCVAAGAILAMEIYELHLVSTCVGPRWLSVEHRGRVPVERNQVTLDGELLEVYGSRTASGRVRTGTVELQSGTVVEVWSDANGLFVCARADDVDRARAAQVAREEAAQAALREREQSLRGQALELELKVVYGRGVEAGS